MSIPQDFMETAYMDDDELREQIYEYTRSMTRMQLENFLSYIREEWWQDSEDHNEEDSYGRFLDQFENY